MVVSCSAYNCKSRFTKDGVPFHSFPVRPHLRKQWALAIKRTNFKVTNYSRVCGKHFKPQDYLIGLERKKLKRDAVPSIFNFPDDGNNSSNDEESESQPDNPEEISKVNVTSSNEESECQTETRNNDEQENQLQEITITNDSIQQDTETEESRSEECIDMADELTQLLDKVGAVNKDNIVVIIDNK